MSTPPNTRKPHYRYSWEYRAWMLCPRIRRVNTKAAIEALERCILRGLI